jgi:hypothetical protein
MPSGVGGWGRPAAAGERRREPVNPQTCRIDAMNGSIAVGLRNATIRCPPHRAVRRAATGQPGAQSGSVAADDEDGEVRDRILTGT